MRRPLRTPPRLTLGPGPSPVAAETLRALATPPLGHLDPAFLAVMDETQARLRETFRTTSPATLAVSGTGGAGMEAVLVNLVEAGDRVVVGQAGEFGRRLADQARRLGATVDVVEATPGAQVPLDALRRAAESSPTAAVAVVHAETSTGVLQDLDGLGEVCRRAGALLLVDCVTSLGGVAFAFDASGIDAAFSCSQKCLGAPPGLAPVAFSERALERFRRRRTPPPSRYFDLGLLLDYWGGARTYHHTLSSTLVYALHEGLGLLLDEGLDAAAARHRRVQRFLIDGLADLGLEPFVDAASRLPMVTAVRVPDGVDDAATRAALLSRFGVEIGGGLGALKGRVWRIGHMGHGAREEAMLAVLGALRVVLGR
ncbi:MAG TPA: aminotransferase class V-fold PLP-dependent enzyme [Planctomycetota bacterium]|nr:aminotransferase class V-fold PLP-dependent enzyme [Planctomycetota bacterium]